MTIESILPICRTAAVLLGFGTAAPLCAGMIAGVAVAFLQTITQLQEQTTVYLVKLTVIAAVIYFSGGIFWHELLELWTGVLEFAAWSGK